MYPFFSLLQDILTKKIISHAIERVELYYVNDICQGRIHLTKGSVEDRRQCILLWHSHLEHPYFGYQRRLMPSLFSSFSLEDF